MENNVFKRHLITKLIVGGAFAVLTIGAIIGVTIVNAKVIAPNAGFITAKLCSVDSGGAKNSMGDRLGLEIEEEGVVLAKNDDDVLPLSKDVTKVNVFGYDVTNWVISDSGSGTAGPGTGQKAWELLDSLEERGISYNQEIIDYYKSWASPRDRGAASYGETYGSNGYKNTYYRLTNPSLTYDTDYRQLYDKVLSEAQNEGVDTAIVVIGRWGGEHIDPPHEQVNNYKSKISTTNKERGYLELTLEEEDLLANVGKDYDKVIVIINSTNVMQMDFMTEIDGLDACLLVGPTGTMGAKALPRIMWGDVNPSGRTADTWPMKHKYNPTYYTVGYWPSSSGGTYYTGSIPSNANLSKHQEMSTANFADYIEGIYVGYKWFETADAEGYWDQDPYNGYENVVAYPFGHGLSYTTFSWELIDAKPNKNSNIRNGEDIVLQVKVTNTGNVPGRDVVEVYLTAEYYPGEIEKSSVKLVGFQKTKLLMPNESETVSITVRTNDFLSFDCYGKNDTSHTGWELDRGSYELKLMTSAHLMKEHVTGGNTIKYNVPDTIDLDEDPDTGNESKPLFTGNDAIDGVSMDGDSIGENVKYLTREHFDPLLTDINPCRPWNKGLEIADGNYPTAYSTAMKNAWDNATKDVFGNAIPTTEPRFGANNGLAVLDDKYQLTELGKELAADYDDPQWEDLLDQLVWNDSAKVVGGQSYFRPGIPSMGLKEGRNEKNNADYYDAEGASQVGATYDNNKRFTAYPMPCVQAQCWNDNMPYLFGLSEAKDMIIGGKDALYGPASNIHRSPYGGRNAEYHSEDGYLAGKCLANVTRGLADGGKAGFIKHFCMNDNEYHRVGLWVWATEQALREVYLKPFEESIKNGEATALMTSFNRIGAVWSGGSQALVQGVLRNEWGFHGMTITDYTENSNLQDGNQQLRAGGNYILGDSTFSDPGQNNASVRLKWRMRENAKQVAYAHIRALYTNYLYNTEGSNKAIVSSSSKAPWVWWDPLLHCAEALVIVSFAFGCLAALFPSDPEFRAHLFKKKEKAAE